MSGACKVMIDEPASRSSRGTYSIPKRRHSSFGAVSKPRTRHPKPRMIRATAVPIFPVPTMPTVELWISKPSRPSSAKLPSRTRA